MSRKISKNKVTAVILTGGSGVRMKSYEYPKQFIRLLNKPMFIHSVLTYENVSAVDEIILVINKEFESRYKRILKNYPIKKVKCTVYGGKQRHDSIINALEKIDHNGLVLIHNGSNPCTPPATINACIKAARKHPAVTAYMPSYHTVFIKNDGKIGKNLKRNELGFCCDPQVFRADVIKKACTYAEKNSVKDIPMVELVKKIKFQVHLVSSNMFNFKVTHEGDLQCAKYIISRKDQLAKTL